MTDIASLETPVPVIDLDIVERNLVRMQDYARAHGLALRPHIKTHKLPYFAKRQVELGAIGITCQKLGEAEVMAEAGLDDILISYPLIGAAKGPPSRGADRQGAHARRDRQSPGAGDGRRRPPPRPMRRSAFWSNLTAA